MSEPFTHIIAQTKQNIELLIAHRHITEADGQFILARLPNVEKDTAIAALTKQASRLNVSSRCVVPKCRALWDWSSEDPNDLGFHAGEIIEIISETNAEWWTGRNRAGKQGVFPATYVEKLRSSPSILSEKSPISSPEITKADAPHSGPTNRYSSPTPLQQHGPPGALQKYSSPSPPQQHGPPGALQKYSSPTPPQQYPSPPGVIQPYTPPPSRPPPQYGPPGGPPPHQYGPPPGPPQPYGPPPGPPQHYGPPPGPPQPYGPPPGPVYYPSGPPPNNKPPSQLAPAPQQGKLNNLGTTMAQSAASGVGFGAGSALGSGLVHAIF
ncbi:hypothetical protein V8B97DRAFT_1618798 [Scleroderma yunnanense]